MPTLAGYIVPHPPLIVPAVGRGEEQKIQATIDAYRQVAREIAELAPDVIILSSPHATAYGDYFHLDPSPTLSGSLTMFRAPQVSASVDNALELVERIASEATVRDIALGTLGDKHAPLDHGALVPLHFILREYKDFQMVRLSPSGLPAIDHYQVGMMIRDVIPEDLNTVWVASGDLSHKLKKEGPYGLAKEGPVFDKQITEAMASGDFQTFLAFDTAFCHKAAECGLGSFTMMAGAFDGYSLESKLLSYEGPFGVGYAVASFKPLGKDDSRCFLKHYVEEKQNELDTLKSKSDAYVNLARASLEHYIRHNKPLSIPRDLPREMTSEKAGVFVSIRKDGRLRGCIGTIRPTTSSVAKEIIENAISAGTRDYRFSPIKERELSRLEYSVDVLMPPEDIDSEDRLDVTKYGVIVRSGHRSGLLLPNLDGIDTIEEQVRIARQKAGIRDGESYTLQRFEVIRHH